MLPAWVYKPRTPGPHPVLVRIASGAGEQARPVFDTFTQFAVNVLGYAVVTPNVRGAAGYGRSFSALGETRREDAIRDIGSLLVWIGVQGDLDRASFTGESQGASVALARWRSTAIAWPRHRALGRGVVVAHSDARARKPLRSCTACRTRWPGVQ